VLNADDERVMAMRSRTGARVVTFGVKQPADVRATEVVLDELARPIFAMTVAGHTVQVSLPLHGAHHVSNALAASAVAIEAGLELERIADALGRVRPVSRWRMQVTERADGVVVVNDAYNANPESMRAALDALTMMDARRAGARLRCSGRWPSSARTHSRSTAVSAPRSRQPACTASLSSVVARRRLLTAQSPAALTLRWSPWSTTSTRRSPLSKTSFAVATWCW
jgi:Mur ligase middle domain/Mur ligase family, glutamate ligase domain